MSLTFFPFLGAFFWIGALILVGVVLRAKVPLFQKFLMPASLIGGILGFILMRLDIIGLPQPDGYMRINEDIFANITFHLFALSFVGIGLVKNEGSGQKGAGKNIMKGAIWVALMLSVTYTIQGLVGIGVFSAFNSITGSSIDILSGILLGTGFTQGPGQAQGIALVWEANFNYVNAVNIGFAFSAAGFLVAGLAGVPFARWLVVKGKTSAPQSAFSDSFITGINKIEEHTPAGVETMNNANLSTLGLHIATFFFVYALTYLLAFSFEYYKVPLLSMMAFGVLFLWTLITGKLFMAFVTKLKADYVYDNATIKALTSAVVDLLICSVFLGIDVESLRGILTPIVIATVMATIATIVVCVYFGSLLSEYQMERAMVLLGYSTGTGASALLLLRVVDPALKTPVATEMGFVIIAQMVTTFNLLAFLLPIIPSIGVMNTILAFVGIFVLNVILVYVLVYFQNRNRKAVG